MSNYRHDPAPNHRAKQFAAYCAQHITDWPSGKIAAASGKFKKLCFVDRVNGLSPAIWATCSRKQWLQAKETWLLRSSREQSANSAEVACATPVGTVKTKLINIMRSIFCR